MLTFAIPDGAIPCAPFRETRTGEVLSTKSWCRISIPMLPRGKTRSSGKRTRYVTCPALGGTAECLLTRVMQPQEDEQRLLQVVWSLLRAGAKKEALEFCRQSGQNWRAASLSTALSSEPLPLSTGAHPPRLLLFFLLLSRHRRFLLTFSFYRNSRRWHSERLPHVAAGLQGHLERGTAELSGGRGASS